MAVTKTFRSFTTESIARSLRELAAISADRAEIERRALLAQDTANLLAYMQLTPEQRVDHPQVLELIRERLGV